MQYWVQLGRFPKCARDSLGRIADGFVRGTRVAFPADGPDSKYAALFDARPEFEDLRLAFLVFSDPQSKVNILSLISHGVFYLGMLAAPFPFLRYLVHGHVL